MHPYFPSKAVIASLAVAALTMFAGQSLAASAPTNPNPLEIRGLQDKYGNDLAKSEVAIGLGDDLAVVLDTVAPIEASHYALFLDGQEIDGLTRTYYDAKLHALVFHLERNPQNADAWASVLGSPTRLTRNVNVALGEKPENNGPATPSIAGPKGKRPDFRFHVLTFFRLLLAALAIIAMWAVVWGSARKTTVIKDNQVPQIDPAKQTFSLARLQMAFWFSLIFASYVALWILLDDINTLSEQALTLMGISGATALGATVVDRVKDTPTDTVNQALRLLGINDYSDVLRIQQEIADREHQLNDAAKPVSSSMATQLKSEIVDRQLKLRTWEDKVRPFQSQGWFADVSTDFNGPALHRLQVVCWTALLGLIFVIGVWRYLAMPQFSNILLALMGISGGGYVGFKYSETGQ